MIYVVGDIHGNLYTIDKIANYDDINFDIIQVGDFGIGFSNITLDRLKEINELLKEKNSHLYILRGNHDNPNYFNGKIELGFSNIFLVKDYDYIKIQGYDVLFIGGAISIDRIKREIGYSYWLNERVVYNEEKLKDIKPNIIITHTRPSFAQPIGVDSEAAKEWARKESRIGGNLRKDLLEEISILDKVYETVDTEKLLYSFYGHFHKSYRTEYQNSMFVGLDIDEIYGLPELEQWMIYEKEARVKKL